MAFLYFRSKINPMRDIKQVCVYCASSKFLDEKYYRSADEMGALLAQNDITLIYGGGSTGLMGRIADKVLALGGNAIGVIPEFMDAIELGHKGVQLEVVPDMHTRKKRFFVDTDALVTLPGGCGTFEELLEALTWKRLGLLTCPIVIVNVDGYYQPLLDMLDRAVDEHFMNPKHREMWVTVDSADQVLEAIQKAPEWHADHFKYAITDKQGPEVL